YQMVRSIYEQAIESYRQTPAFARAAGGSNARMTPARVRRSGKTKVLVAHNYYRLPGGEDSVFLDEIALLQANGHEVFPFMRDNKDIHEIDHPSIAAGAVWSRESYCALSAMIRKHRS